MTIGSKHEVEESVGGSVETRVQIETSDVMGGMSIGEVVESIGGVGDDGEDSDKKRVGSIGVGR